MAGSSISMDIAERPYMDVQYTVIICNGIHPWRHPWQYLSLAFLVPSMAFHILAGVSVQSHF
jgi:hypothetical protein